MAYNIFFNDGSVLPCVPADVAIKAAVLPLVNVVVDDESGEALVKKPVPEKTPEKVGGITLATCEWSEDDAPYKIEAVWNSGKVHSYELDFPENVEDAYLSLTKNRFVCAIKVFVRGNLVHAVRLSNPKPVF